MNQKTQPLQKPILTRRMKWIVKQMREHGAIIQEHRDAFLEISHWTLEWETEDLTKWSGSQGHEVKITEKMRLKLIRAGLIKSIENNPVYDKIGKFVTTESVYGLVEDEIKR